MQIYKINTKGKNDVLHQINNFTNVDFQKIQKLIFANLGIYLGLEKKQDLDFSLSLYNI